MLWIEPYERPVLATSVRMLAPPSYALRNSFRTWSLDLFNFFIGTSPLLMSRRIPSVRTRHTTAGGIGEMSGEFDQIAIVVGPEVLGAVGQQNHPLRVQCLGGAGVVRHQHHRADVTAQRIEDLLA